MWAGVRRTREYKFIVIEEVMQQKAPRVPADINIQQPRSESNRATNSSLQGVRRRLSANFFKATFSSRSKAVTALRAPCASRSVEDTTKIGNAEAKPVTRNRPRSALCHTSCDNITFNRSLFSLSHSSSAAIASIRSGNFCLRLQFCYTKKDVFEILDVIQVLM
ncbi:PREDICTED: uncharacterized protein LOC106109567 [Papilio polytes]|uniref:uncharacterized protein LOC106109567 n=1 Tax=Papilio polytes TaxID=76194 RepID=UPI0006768F28|nr:PREDICTED: uncharacterized protein LOC106109567 [Papilio polytes]